MLVSSISMVMGMYLIVRNFSWLKMPDIILNMTVPLGLPRNVRIIGIDGCPMVVVPHPESLYVVVDSGLWVLENVEHLVDPVVVVHVF